LLAGATALAQPKGLPKIELERLTLNPAGTGSLLLGTGELLQKGGYRLSLTGHYENKPLQFRELVRTVDESGQPISSEEFRGSVVKHRVTGHLAGAYGLTRWLELSAQVPVLLSQRGDDLTQRNVGQPAEGLALGTPYLGLRLGLLSQRDGGDAVDLAVGLNAGLPLGGSESLARDNGLRAVPSVMVGRDFGPLRAAVDAGVLLRHRAAFPETTALDSEVGSGLRLGATLSTTGEGLRGELDVLGHLPFHEERASVEALAGARLPLSESLEAYALAGVGFGDAPGTASFRGLLGVAFGGGSPRCVAGGQHTPRQCPDLDDDHDGVLNRSDACPLEGGKVDATGCPEKDGDGDGVLDTADRCPTVPGAPERQGCPATDTDTDGVEDAQDQCPSVPGEAAHQGCPDTDRDGLRDSEDKCPTEAGPAERQGCPLRDSDQDGLLDEKDSCPTVAGIPEMKGCPPKDTDNDTVQDHVDNCPREAGPPSNQGCPVQQRQQVIIKKGRIELKDTVYFDTNKATIQPRSYALLDNVAKVLLEHPELEKVWIEGHTDSTGTPSENLKLSQRRAEAVRDYLINRGVGFQRLDARGFGQERPIADNKTVQGRAANRRVDFLTTPREGEQQ
jgi:outer membrane protein OmpA-like peptidoglycan-associated protein